MITDYLVELVGELHIPAKRRRRILAEVEDHLACAAAELHASGLSSDDAEHDAVARFGPAPELARAFISDEAALSGRRVASAAAALATLAALVFMGPLGRGVPIWRVGFPIGLVGFAMGQVALVAGWLSFVRARRPVTRGGPRGVRLELVLRGAVVVVASAALTTVYGVAGALLSSGPNWGPRAWLVLGVLVVGIVLTSVRIARASGLAHSAASIDNDRATVDLDPLADIHAIVISTVARLERRAPAFRPMFAFLADLSRTLPSELDRRAPRLARCFDLARHPWRFAITVALAAGLTLAGGHALLEGGLSTSDAVGEAAGAVLIVTIEAALALVGFGLLGRFLGVRPAREPRHPTALRR